MTWLQPWIAPAAWLALALLHGVWRLSRSEEADPIRPSGPLGLL